jgi:hypothetical protein
MNITRVSIPFAVVFASVVLLLAAVIFPLVGPDSASNLPQPQPGVSVSVPAPASAPGHVSAGRVNH